MELDLWKIYALMLKSRLFEEAVSKLWKDGLISGEMHLGTGEEAIIASVVSQLRKGDAMALDHRGTAAMLMRGVDPVLLLLEFLGHPKGLCAGMGGHMHLFSRELLITSSGIVGAAGPSAAGLALAAKYMRPDTVAVAFFGDGAINQGMLMESMNLSSVWKLPILFVCKDDCWAITTRSSHVTGGSIRERARGFGITFYETDGLDLAQTWESSKYALEHIRTVHEPAFLHVKCVHLEGHFLGFQLIRTVRNPLKEIPAISGSLLRSSLRPGGASVSQRLKGLTQINSMVMATMNDPREIASNDPLLRTRSQLQSDSLRLNQLETSVQQEISNILEMTAQECAA